MKKFFKWGGIALLVLIVIGAIASAGGGGKDPSTSTPSEDVKTVSNTEPTEAKNEVAIGEEITVGEVKWIVEAPEKKDTIPSNNQFIDSPKATGMFVVVQLTAELIGKESGTIDSTQLKIIDSKGRKFEPTQNSDVAVILGDNWIFLKQVNPNVPVKGTAVFEVAKDSAGLKLEIDDLRMFDKAKPGYVDLGL